MEPTVFLLVLIASCLANGTTEKSLALPYHLKTLWISAQPSGVSATPPSFLSSANLLIVSLPIFQIINEDVEQDWMQCWPSLLWNIPSVVPLFVEVLTMYVIEMEKNCSIFLATLCSVSMVVHRIRHTQNTHTHIYTYLNTVRFVTQCLTCCSGHSSYTNL